MAHFKSRTVARQHPAQRDDIGDLVTRRPLPGPAVDQIDPFLFLNHHGPQTYAPNNRGLPFGRIRIAVSRPSPSSSTASWPTTIPAAARASSAPAGSSG